MCDNVHVVGEEYVALYVALHYVGFIFNFIGRAFAEYLCSMTISLIYSETSEPTCCRDSPCLLLLIPSDVSPLKRWGACGQPGVGP